MSHADYRASHQIAECGYPIHALIMAAMRQAHRPDLEKLRAVFPDIWAEFLDRERCFGGLLAGERVVSEPPACAQMPPGTKQWINSLTDTKETSSDAS